MPLNYFRQRYNEFVLCLKKNSGDDEACIKQRQLAHSICPDEWVFILFFNVVVSKIINILFYLQVTQWDEQRTAGNFLGIQVTEPAADSHGHH